MTFLEAIARNRVERVEEARLRAPEGELRDRCLRLPAARDARAGLARWPSERRAVIAEVKRKSPSKGWLCPDLDPERFATAYQKAGAFAISVLTEPNYFAGSVRDLEAVRRAVDLPVLYKDFVVDPYQIWAARAAGADLVLLIAALLGEQTPRFAGLAREAGLEPLVEVHSPTELAVALASGARLVGINSRDLRSFRVDLSVSRRLLRDLPGDVFAVAESGLRTPQDLDRLGRAGARAFLIGEALVRAADPEAALRLFVERQGADRAVRP
jgi:indole-3-glycerol phosphate synthase